MSSERLPPTSTPSARPRRVFTGIVEIAGYYRNLQDGFQSLGVDSVQVDLNDHPFGYSRKPRNAVVKFAEWASGRRILSRQRGSLLWPGWSLLDVVGRLCLLLWALLACDVFILDGYGFLKLWELPVLRLFGKRVVYVCHGSESRPPYIDRTQLLLPTASDPKGCIRETRKLKDRMRWIERFAHVLINSPLQGHFHERPFVNFLTVGIPQLPSELPAARPEASPGPVRILHSPSKPQVKGTDLIREAIQTLKESGLTVDYVEVIGQPNAKVQEELAKCDFVVDQAYCDTPMAGFATEAAWMGKPTLVGGYGTDEIRRVLRPDQVPPSAYRRPEELGPAIRELILDAELRRSLGERAREFVRTTWSARAVAERFLRIFAGDIPGDWWFDPSGTRYLHGHGLTDEAARASVRSLIQEGGPEALQLSDKPDLCRAFVEFSGPRS